MNELNDCELLQTFADTRNEAAFSELVRRHLDLVYCAALRIVRDGHAAKDVSQTVFVELARNARRVAEHPVLAGWLHRTTKNVALKLVRTNVRRAEREREAWTMETDSSLSKESSWNDVGAQLDTALDALNRTERDAILLRFFEDRTAKQMASALAISEEAAQKRVSRALERLRGRLQRRGVSLTAAALGGLMVENAVTSAPAGMASAISTTVTTSTMAATGYTAMHWFYLKLASALTIGAIVGGVGIHWVERRPKAQAVVRTVEAAAQEPASISPPMRQSAQAASGLTPDEYSELLRLRGEVGRLRREAAEAAARPQLQTTQAPLQTTTPASSGDYNQVRNKVVNGLKQTMLSFRFYSMSRQGEYPTNFEQVSDPYYSLGGVNLAAYEFFSNAVPVTAGKYPDAVVLREVKPRNTPDGQWVKAYGIADGRVLEVTNQDGNFDAWEAEKRVIR